MNEKHLESQPEANCTSANSESTGADTVNSEASNVLIPSSTNHLKESISINSQHDLDKREEICRQIQRQLNQGRLAIINPRRKNGLIIYKTYHAEFAGPGAIIGGQFDLDTTKIIAVGNISLTTPNSSQARKQAYKMRRQWVRLTKQIIDNPQPTERAQVILNQFEHWFDLETVEDLPDEAFALLVGVLPQTVRRVRNIELL